MPQNSIIPIQGIFEPSAKEGYRSVQYAVDLTGASGQAAVNLTDVVQKGQISRVVSMYFDNADNAFAVAMICNATGQRFFFAPNTQGYIRLLLSNLPELTFFSPSPCTFNVNFLNFYVRELIWETQAMSPVVNPNQIALPDGKILVGDSIGEAAAVDMSGDVKIDDTGKTTINNGPMDFYETGNFVPADGSGAGLILTINKAQFSRYDSLIVAYMDVTYPATVNANVAAINGLPYSSVNGAPFFVPNFNVGGALVEFFVNGGTSGGFFALITSGAGITNANLSGARMRIIMTYFH